jgi:peptidoglycan/LPS O-acetylase OafA/YrhL
VPNQRSLGLDLLRLLAVLMVIASHLTMDPIPAARMSYLSYVVVYGAAGVNLFFVLSGFLVSGLLFNEYKQRGELSIKRFYVRRAWKIYPASFFFLAVSYLYCRYGLGYKIHDRVMAREVFFFQNYAQGYWNHTWSLAVEEHFYIVLPLILLFMVKRKGGENPFSSIPLLALAISVLALTLRCLTCYLQPTYGVFTHVYPTHLRIDALFFGVLLAYFYHFRTDTFRSLLYHWRFVLIGGGAAGLISIHFMNPSVWFCHTFCHLQESLSAGAILCGVMLCAIPRNWATRSLAMIGSYSYSIYLWHMVTIYYVTPKLRDSTSWDGRAALYLVSAFVVGITMAKLVEVPTLSLRDRWFPSKSRAHQPALDPGLASERVYKRAAKPAIAGS